MAARCCKADAIVVLGCRGSAALRRRLEIGIRLFERGVAPLLVLSGGGGGPLPEAEAMRQAAIDHGVPETALLIDAVSRNTFENARETALGRAERVQPLPDDLADARLTFCDVCYILPQSSAPGNVLDNASGCC